jgi:outer membrane protein assembly factor BamB
VTSVASQSQDWPQYLGPNGNGTIETPISPTAKLAEAWRRPSGAGMSAITVSRGRAYTLFTDETDDVLVAIDAKTGKDVWTLKLGKTHADAQNGGPGSTPAIAGELVIVLGSSCRLVAANAADGKLAWDVDLASAYKSRFASRGGCSISPLVHGTTIVLPTGAPEGDRLVALDAASGKQVWSAKGVERSINTNPAYWQSASGPQILYHYVKAPGTSGIAAVDLKDGSVAWSLDASSGMMSNTAPMPLPDGRVLLQMWSGSGVLEAPSGAAPRHVWTNEELSALPAPAVHVDGHLYGFGGNSGEFFKCVEAATGKTRWSSRIYRGAAAVSGRTLVIQSESSGLLRLVAADPAGFKEQARLAVLKPGASTLTPPTIAGGVVFVRNLEEIVAVAIR